MGQQFRGILTIPVKQDGEIESRLQRVAVAQLLIASVALVYGIACNRDVANVSGLDPVLNDFRGGIAAGIVDGRRLGDNARAALITRGLAEVGRLATALGADSRTLMGLSGLGDLLLTCTGRQSRNFSLGVALGEGQQLTEILAARSTVAEGVYTATSVGARAGRLSVDLPICAAVEAVLHHGADIDTTIATLLARPITGEMPDNKRR